MNRREGRHTRSPAAVVVVAVVVLLVVLVVVGWQLSRRLGNDYLSSSIGLNDDDSGSTVVVEPEDEFDIGLVGERTHPDAAWVIIEMDDSVIELVSSHHEPEGTGAGEIDGGEPAYYLPLSVFVFTGKALGESELLLELWVEGDLLRAFEATVSVVDDACELFDSQEPSTQFPHRCG